MIECSKESWENYPKKALELRNNETLIKSLPWGRANLALNNWVQSASYSIIMHCEKTTIVWAFIAHRVYSSIDQWSYLKGGYWYVNKLLSNG